MEVPDVGIVRCELESTRARLDELTDDSLDFRLPPRVS
jgi:hypothetical protein